MNKFEYYLKRILCHVFIFLFSGTTYYFMEIIFKETHTSHWSMFLLAGFSALFFIDGLNDLFGYDMDYLLQILICSTAITIGELCVGLLVNKDHSIWDYSNLPFNYKGQICLLFYFLWMFLSAIFIPILDYIEWKWFNYEPDNPPYYKIFGKEIFKFKNRM